MVETVNILEKVLGEYESTMIREAVNKNVKNITD